MGLTRGIFIPIWGDPAYGWSAHNLALSIKKHSPNMPIHILSQRDTLNGVPLDFFDHVEWWYQPVSDPGLFKAQLYDKLPFDYTMYLDADAMCVAPVEPFFDRMIEDGKPYRCFVHDYYDKDSPDLMPLMVWATRSTIWNHYGFDNEKLPATQSSLQFIQKCEWSEQMFNLLQKNFNNPIPLQNLRSYWGGGQPDELYLNVTLAQLDYKPDIQGGIYFGNEITLRPHQIADNHFLLSMFGTAQNIKKIFTNFYDVEGKKYAASMGHRYWYKWNNIAAKKHANKRKPNMRSSVRMAQGGSPVFSSDLQPVKTQDKVYLLTSYYKSSNQFRQDEIDKCLKNNIDNPDIDLILNLGSEKVEHSKVINKKCERPTYNDFINEADAILSDNVGHRCIFIIANSDIYFDGSINWLRQIDLKGKLLALSRHDMDINGQLKHFVYEWSQDAWVFQCDNSTQYNGLKQAGKYFLGLPGCDNRFAYEAHQCGYEVLNPSKDIKAIHLHNSNERSYKEEDRLPAPYRPVYICKMPSLLPKLVIKQPGKVGDIINCLPIAKWYADRGNIVIWDCPKEYHHLFDYVDYVKPKEGAKGDKVIDISFGLNRQSPSQREWERVRNEESFVSVKYRLAEVPISELRKLQYRPNEPKEISLATFLPPKGDFALVHDNSHYGTPIEVQTTLPIVKFEPQNGYTIFDWRLIIQRAKEIHCIDSSLCNFVDALKPDGKLFYYKTDRVPLKGDETILEATWTRINCLEPITA